MIRLFSSPIASHPGSNSLLYSYSVQLWVNLQCELMARDKKKKKQYRKMSGFFFFFPKHISATVCNIGYFLTVSIFIHHILNLSHFCNNYHDGSFSFKVFPYHSLYICLSNKVFLFF